MVHPMIPKTNKLVWYSGPIIHQAAAVCLLHISQLYPALCCSIWDTSSQILPSYHSLGLSSNVFSLERPLLITLSKVIYQWVIPSCFLLHQLILLFLQYIPLFEIIFPIFLIACWMLFPPFIVRGLWEQEPWWSDLLWYYICLEQ